MEVRNLRSGSRFSGVKITALILVLAFTVLSLCGCGIDSLFSSEDLKEISSMDQNAEYLTKKGAVKLAKSQISDKGEKKVLNIREAEDESYIVYKGKMLCDGKIYKFSIDSASGNILSWMVEKQEK